MKRLDDISTPNKKLSKHFKEPEPSIDEILTEGIFKSYKAEDIFNIL